MSAIEENVRSLNPGELISLYRFDASVIGGPVVYFTQGAFESTPIQYAGIIYTPIDVEFTNFETNAQGTLPRPKLKIANGNDIFQSVINSYGDLLGCTFQRLRTFKKFLDGQPNADPLAYYGPDTFIVERKSSENPVFIEWELSAAIDQEGKKIPTRQVVRDTCLWRYRSYNPTTDTFDYSKVQCPYVGTSYFDALGQSTTKANDQCGRRLSDCEKRFGVGNPLPFGGFPGAARVTR